MCHAEDKSALWGFISRYAPKATPQSNPILDRLAGYAVAYYQDFIKPHKHYRLPDANEQAALEDLIGELEGLASDALPEDIQTQVYEIGKRHDFADLKAWFRALYETLLGQEQGPRMGSFIALYGIEETISLIRRVLAGEDLASS